MSDGAILNKFEAFTYVKANARFSSMCYQGQIYFVVAHPNDEFDVEIMIAIDNDTYEHSIFPGKKFNSFERAVAYLLQQMSIDACFVTPSKNRELEEAHSYDSTNYAREIGKILAPVK